MSDSWQPGPAWLFCPADRPDRYTKALAAADVVILDLEDAVAPDKKAQARDAVRSLVRDGVLDAERTVVRVNAADSAEQSADLELLGELHIPRVMLAKSEYPQDIRALPCDVVALVETARGLERAGALAEPDNVVAMMWGADDLVASMGGTGSRRPDGSYRDLARFARVRVLTAAKAAGLLALDAVHMDIPDTTGLRAECEDAVASGFDATVAIHPSQVAVIRSTYAPTDDQIDWARRLFAHVGDDRGVTTFEGRMVDGPIYKQAERVIRLAALTDAATKEESGR
ncbi:HpcH/HpaI aldolase/citrate lyase family protein [Flexivirga oryzae]|uniref:Citrate lyase subunit beta/citryl-CoA lyase n=1 Tax=Flexivirga oryzae TaxID=1794944 RepID=A0A839N7K3_9MICO|nr:CoA ester lyase [Flexivirga oryzae]MBB2891994.1 citrate lyase subunit beta/citryl-CoA lyase [Flexivirga oryzae]